MATWTFEGLDQYQEQLKKLEYNAEGLCKYCLWEGAKIIADAVKANVPHRTNDLKDSLCLIHMKKERDLIYTGISFPGYDRKGVPNQLKANVLEYGKSDKKRRPFIEKTIKAVSAQANEAIRIAMDQRINLYFK